MNKNTGNRVRQPKVDEVTREEVAYEDIVSGFEVAPDRIVVLTPEELERVEPRKSREISILQFCRSDEIPTLAITRPYYLGPNTGGDKAYKLLADVMRSEGVVGIGRMVMRSVEYLVCLRVLEDGTLSCEQLAFADEINSTDELVSHEQVSVTDSERDMASRLVEAMTKPLDFESMHDEHREKVMELINLKAAGMEPAAQVDAEPAPAADLLAALESSLEAVKSEGKGARRRSKSAA